MAALFAHLRPVRIRRPAIGALDHLGLTPSLAQKPFLAIYMLGKHQGYEPKAAQGAPQTAAGEPQARRCVEPRCDAEIVLVLPST